MRTARVLAVAFAAAIALSGCAASNGGDPAPSSSEAVTFNPDARIKMAGIAAVTKWDPGLNVGGPEIPLLRLVYEPLVAMDPQNNAIPGLALEWATEDGGTSFTFTLREGVEFTDGTAFNAEAAKAVLDHYLTVEGGTLKGMLANVESVSAPAEYTLVVTQKKPDVTLPFLLADRPGMMIAPSSFASGAVTSPVGSGPFTWVAEEPTVSLTLDKNEEYWNAEQIHLAGVDLQVMEDAVARMNAIKSGTIDLTIVGADQIAEAEALPNADVYSMKPRALRTITVNPDLEPAFADERVRQALNMAIDREGIVAGILFGAGEPAYQMRPEGLLGASTTLKPVAYDPEKAKALLAEAGYADGLTFEFVTQPRFQKEAEAIQANWAAIGVDMTVSVLPGPGAGQAMWYEKTASIGMANFDGRFEVGIALNALFLPGTVNNPGNVVSDTVTGLLTDAMGETDAAARQGLIDEVAQELVDNPLGVWPVVWGYEGIVYSDKVGGYQEYQSGFPALVGVGIKAD